jgi:DNA polymerase elongation subunit (family B)
MYISHFTETGSVAIQKIFIPKSEQYSWVECSENDPDKVEGYLSQNFKPVKKIYQKYLNKYRKIEFINSLNQSIKEKIFSNNMPQIFSLDIETEIIDDELDEDNPKGQILSVAFCDTTGNAVFLGIKELTEKQKESIRQRILDYFKEIDDSLPKIWNVKFKKYDTEAQMLTDLFKTFISKMPLITGWNFIKFDWRYLINRCKKIGVNYESASYTGNFFNFTIKDRFNQEISYNAELPAHRAIICYMQLYSKWDTSVKHKSSDELDFVASEILKIKKVNYAGTLMELFRDDYETFAFYNIVDTILVALIHLKIDTISTAISLSNDGKCDLHNILHASIICEALYSNYYMDNKVQIYGKEREYNIVFVNKKSDAIDTSKYSGGYVLNPEPGIQEFVCILDYESEFPSIMMAFNTGIETLIGYVDKDDPNSFTDILGNKLLIDHNEHIVTDNGIVYTKKYDSSTRKIVNSLFDSRVADKNAVEEISEEIDYLENLLKNEVI